MFKLLMIALLLSATPAYAQMGGIKVDDGIRSAQSMVISGDSVIDDETVDDDLAADFENSVIIPDEEPMEEDLPGDSEPASAAVVPTILPENPVEPISPFSPSAPKEVRKRVVKPYEQMKIRRSIMDERIDDHYVQEMVKDNYLFTPDLAK